MKGENDGDDGVRNPNNDNNNNKKDRKQCVHQQTFGCCQLTASGTSKEGEKKKRKKRSYITELLKQRDTDRQTGDEDRAPERDKKGKHITLSSDKDNVMVVPPTQTPNRQRADVSCEVLNIQELCRVKGYYTHNVCIMFVQLNWFPLTATASEKGPLQVMSYKKKKKKGLPFTDNVCWMHVHASSRQGKGGKSLCYSPLVHLLDRSPYVALVDIGFEPIGVKNTEWVLSNRCSPLASIFTSSVTLEQASAVLSVMQKEEAIRYIYGADACTFGTVSSRCIESCDLGAALARRNE